VCETAADEVLRFSELGRCQPASRVGPTPGREEAPASVAVQKVTCCGEKLEELSLISSEEGKLGKEQKTFKHVKAAEGMESSCSPCSLSPPGQDKKLLVYVVERKRSVKRKEKPSKIGMEERWAEDVEGEVESPSLLRRLSEAILTQAVQAGEFSTFSILPWLSLFYPPQCSAWIDGGQLIRLSLPLKLWKEALHSVCGHSCLLGSGPLLPPHPAWGPAGRPGGVNVSPFHPSQRRDTSWSSFYCFPLWRGAAGKPRYNRVWSRVLMEKRKCVCTTQIPFPPSQVLQPGEEERFILGMKVDIWVHFP